MTSNPPGYGTEDVVSFNYDPARGNLVPLTRTDPMVGTTTFHYDAFHRRIGVTDVNGVLSETRFDPLDRVIEQIERSGPAAPNDPVQPGDLVTSHIYSPFGDPFCRVLPRGNGLELRYDPAGRMRELWRGTPVASPTATSCLRTDLPRERTVYELDDTGQRTNERHETWPGDAVVGALHAETSYVYSTRCHLDKVIQAPGTLQEAITENAFDCNGNLERTWDANHPSDNQANPATAVYGFDELDRLTSVAQPWGGAGGGSVVTSYSYDVQDHLASVIDGEGTPTTYVYSDRDLMTSEVSQVSGTTTHGYNEHGELTTTTDARGITTTRTLDPLNRVTSVDYPATATDVSYTYDDPLVPFSKGRLTKLERSNGEVVAYAFDRFGRLLQDGALSMTYDVNSNPSTVSYPGGVVASYTYDFADRPVSLSFQVGGGGPQTVVTSATYLPSGPLAGLTLANGLAESRAFDRRYSPTRILVPGRLDWAYTTDAVGNPTAITQTVPSAQLRSYGYQDFQYYLTSGAGPWPGPLSWSYDRIGNRLTETRGALTDTYNYLPNSGATGHTAVLDSITLGTLGTRDYTFGPASHLNQVATGATSTTYTRDAEGRLTQLFSAPSNDGSALHYDGRGFLAEAQANPFTVFQDSFENGTAGCWSLISGGPAGSTTGCSAPPARPITRVTYNSATVFHSLARESGTRGNLFYFAGRPVPQLTQPAAVGASPVGE